MYRRAGLQARPEGFGSAALDGVGVTLEGHWQGWLCRRAASEALKAISLDVGLLSEPMMPQAERGSISHAVRVARLTALSAHWYRAFGHLPLLPSLAAACAASSGHFADLEEPDGGTATVMTAFLMASSGRCPDIVVAADEQKAALDSVVSRLWVDFASIPRPRIKALTDFIGEGRAVLLDQDAPHVLLHDAGDVLFEAGERLVIASQKSDPSVLEFVHRALAFAAETQDGRDFEFDPVTTEFFLTPSFLESLHQGCARSFGIWASVRLREEAARAGILAVHCLKEGAHVRLDETRVIPLNSVAANLISAEGARMEAVLAAYHGFDPLDVAGQSVRRLRDELDCYGSLGGVTSGARDQRALLWSMGQFLLVPILQKRLRALPRSEDGVRALGGITEGVSEELVDWRADAERAPDMEAFYRQASRSAISLVGVPPTRRALAMVDAIGASGCSVSWIVTTDDILGSGAAATALGKAVAWVPMWFRPRIMRALVERKIRASEQLRNRYLEQGLVAQERIWRLLAVANGG